MKAGNMQTTLGMEWPPSVPGTWGDREMLLPTVRNVCP